MPNKMQQEADQTDTAEFKPLILRAWRSQSSKMES